MLHVPASGSLSTFSAIPTLIDAGGAELRVEASVGAGTSDGAAVIMRLYGLDRRTVVAEGVTRVETGMAALTLRVPDAQLWSAETPHLCAILTTFCTVNNSFVEYDLF